MSALDLLHQEGAHVPDAVGGNRMVAGEKLEPVKHTRIALQHFNSSESSGGVEWAVPCRCENAKTD
jgi:hypothetical protein